MTRRVPLSEMLLFGKKHAEARAEFRERKAPNPRSKKRPAHEREERALETMSRRTLLVRGAAASLVAAGGVATIAAMSDNEQSNTQPSEPFVESTVESTVKPEVQTDKEIMLGNIRFRIDGAHFSPEEQRTLLTNLQTAYDKLVQTFGEEMVRFDNPVNLRIYRDSSSPNSGTVGWGKMQGKFKANGQPVLETDGFGTPEGLMLNEISEGVVGHELFHLFIQQDAAMWSTAYLEGHAHAFQTLSFGRDKDFLQPVELLKFPELDKVFSAGMDHSFATKLPENPAALRGITVAKMELVWLEFIEKHPDFLQRFYAEYRKRLKAGKKSFDREELIALTIELYPDFAEFYEKNPILHEMGEDGPHSSFAVYVHPASSEMIITGFKTIPFKRNPDGTFQLSSIGVIQNADVAFPLGDQFMIMQIPQLAVFKFSSDTIPEFAQFITNPPEKAFINGKQVPVIVLE